MSSAITRWGSRNACWATTNGTLCFCLVFLILFFVPLKSCFYHRHIISKTYINRQYKSMVYYMGAFIFCITKSWAEAGFFGDPFQRRVRTPRFRSGQNLHPHFSWGWSCRPLPIRFPPEHQQALPFLVQCPSLAQKTTTPRLFGFREYLLHMSSPNDQENWFLMPTFMRQGICTVLDEI